MPGPPAKPPTMADVAAAAGVSRALVSTVFRNVPGASAETRARVLAAADGLGYRIDNRARLLRRSRTRLLGVTFLLADAFSAAVVHELYLEAEARGYELLLSAVLPDHPQRSEAAAVGTLLDGRCDALVLIAPQMPDDELDDLGRRVPTVVLARPGGPPTCDVVRTDDAAVVDLCLDHLTALGHRAIVHVDGGEARGAAERRAAYLRGMAARGLAAHARIVPGGWTEVAGVAAARPLLDLREAVNEVTTFNDAAALGVLLEARHRGIAVPGGLSVMGYDDVAMGALPHIELSSVGQDVGHFAREALTCAETRTADPALPARDVVVAPYLVARSSTATAG